MPEISLTKRSPTAQQTAVLGPHIKAMRHKHDTLRIRYYLQEHLEHLHPRRKRTEAKTMLDATSDATLTELRDTFR